MTLIRRTMVLLALISSAPSYAAIYSVGTPTPSAPCTHSTIVNTQGGDSPLILRRLTIAGNTIGGAHALTLSDDVTLLRSIVDQPGKQVLSGGGNRTIDYVLGNEIFTLGSGAHILAASPRFIDPARGNFRLRAASPAVDYAPGEIGTDMDGSPRSVDLPIVANRNGAFDLGAYERQTLNPLVLNANFDVDANFWPSTGTGTSVWTSTQNAEGAAGSGSVYVSGTGFTTTGSSQCIHLPGPARYALSGWGRAAVATNATSLRWFFRRNGGESCTAGTPDRVGDLVLSDVTKWGRPAPFPIDVSPADWTDNSSITIEFVVSGRDPRGWFDGITLDATPLDDRIFANGFD